MKKLLVLSALLGLLALPAFTADVTFGGDLTYGFISDFSEVAEDTNATIDMKGSVDDYNSVAISLKGIGGALGTEKAVITTDVGAWLDLPVGVRLQWGYDDPDWNWFGDISVFEKESMSAASMAEYWGLDAYITAGMFELEIAGDPASSNFLVGAALMEPIEGLNAEVYFWQGDAALGSWEESQIHFGAGYGGAFGDFDLEVGANFMYDMEEAATNAWAYGFAVTGAFSMIYGEVALTGNETDALNRIYVYATVAPIELLKIFVDAELSLADGTEAFQGIEVGLEFETGGTWWAVGYQVNNELFENLNSPFAYDPTDPATNVLADGGLFAYWDINY
jgi:hypothetical protein